MSEHLSSSKVLAALRDGPLSEPAHAWLYEVRNGTGYSGRERYADALVVSCWPSRGIWVAGIEVKVSRSDWTRELKNPAKSEEIQRFCDHWYIAAAEGVVKPGEVPERWGFYEISAGKKPKPKLVKEAPRLEAQPPSAAFIASILRNASQAQEKARRSARDEVLREMRDENLVADLKKQLRDATVAKEHAERLAGHAKEQTEAVRLAVAEFERETGASIGIGDASRYWRGGMRVAAQFKLAEQLAQTPPRELADRLKSIAAELEAVAASGSAT